MLKIFKNPRLSQVLPIIITLNLEIKTTPMDFILARGVLTFWADTGYFVDCPLNLDLQVPGLSTYRIDNDAFIMTAGPFKIFININSAQLDHSCRRSTFDAYNNPHLKIYYKQHAEHVKYPRSCIFSFCFAVPLALLSFLLSNCFALFFFFSSSDF